MMPSSETEGRRTVALVTGAGSGIGRAAALALWRAGYTLVLAGRRREPLCETAQLAPESAGARQEIVAVPTDVSVVEDVDSLFDTVMNRFGRLDVLFNNAGVGAPAVPVDELPLDDWKRCVDVNLTGAFACAQRAFGIMKAQAPRGGRIINNGSISAHVPRPNSIAYTATKHAITGLTRSLALDGRDHDIACSQIDIGNAETPMTQRMHAGVPQADGRVTSEPTFDVDDCGNAVAYMASLPLTTNVLFMTIMATKMPYVGRG